ncbi:MAG: TIGR02594 family protein [Pseudomonadota bacterium]
MHRIIDSPWNVARHLGTLRAGGTETIIRYFNHQNSGSLPEKRVEPAEAAAIADEGLSLAIVFQQRGGAGGNIGDLDAQSGCTDAKRAMVLADRIGQPDGSAIYFAVDHDFYKASDLASIEAYFGAVASQFGGKYRIGVYGSGTVGKTVRDAGHADLIWLAAATGWSGTRDMLKTNAWALLQKWPPIGAPLPHNGNALSSAWSDFGQFVPGAPALDGGRPSPNTVLMEVTARHGLNMRRGAGGRYGIEKTLPKGTLVHALSWQEEWVQIDLEGDGLADGHVHRDYLRLVSGGFPIGPRIPGTPPTPPTPPTPFTMTGHTSGGRHTSYDVAKAELDLDIREVPGSGNNPRIVMYHTTTNAWSGTDDAVPWCSSFVNYCVEQSGRIGTSSQTARSWENWGQDVSAAPQEGDIVVFERVGKGGHVAFLVEDLGDHVSVLGGNQSDRVRISTYPKNGRLGRTTYKLRGFRRG